MADILVAFDLDAAEGYHAVVIDAVERFSGRKPDRLRVHFLLANRRRSQALSRFATVSPSCAVKGDAQTPRSTQQRDCLRSPGWTQAAATPRNRAKLSP